MSSSRFVASLGAALLTAAGFAVVVLAGAEPASGVAFPAVGAAPAFSTNFEIDGNKPVNGGPNGGMDWNALFSTANPANPAYFGLPGPYTTPTGQQSTGILGRTYSADPDAGGATICLSGSDSTSFPGTNTIDSNPFTTGTAAVNNKGDACTGAAAYEIVHVTGPGYDQLHTILYQYWTRSADATGDMSVFQILTGPVAGRCDDRLIGFDYNANVQNIASYTAYAWQAADCPGAGTGAGTWVVSGTGGSVGAAGANADVVPAGQTANQGTFGESAIDLTALGVLPSGACRTFTTSGFITKTGNSNTAQLIDYVGFAAPLTLSNCNGVTVGKVSNSPNFAPATAFTYVIDQVDSRTVHDASLTGINQSNVALSDQDASVNSITHTINVGDTHTWSRVLAQPDYRVTEPAPLPTGWTLQTIVCSYTDLFAPAGSQEKTATLYQNGAYTDQVFQIFPSSTGAAAPSCVITNAATGLVLNKSVINDNGGSATGASFPLQATGTGNAVVINGTDPNPDPAIGISASVAPGTYALSETPSAGYVPGTWSCVDEAGAAVVATSTGSGTATVALAAGHVVTCVLTNNDIAPTLTVTKVVQNLHGGTLAAGAFPLLLNGGPVTSGTPNTATAGVAYTPSETQQPGYIQSSIVCTDTTAAVLTQPVVLAPGQNATCVITNTDVAPVVSVTKTVSGINPGLAWSFDFTLTPSGGTVGANPQAIAGTGNTTSATTASWSNLTGGVQYTLTETAVPGWQASITCSGTTVNSTGVRTITFTAAFGETIVCSATNAATPSTVSVSKSVTGVGSGLAWSFGFSITPSAGLIGANTQTITGTGSTTSAATASWSGLIPGATYTITEPAQAGWTTSAFSCTGATDTDANPATVTFVAGLAQTIACSASNAAAPSSVSVSKSVTGVAAEFAWSFGFSISPTAGVTGASPQTLSGTGSTTAAATASWTGLTPGATYMIAEAAQAGWTPSFACTGATDTDQNPATVTFVAGVAQTIACSASNAAAPASVTVSKSVTGVAAGFAWSFGFSISPTAGVTGASPQALSGTGSTTSAATASW
ncbi:MAG: hypothetical protein JWN20_1499, partial [Jatrophihabitantaceae bacterium]|nr:hypothetical protein [Jatrophihabitantaceae bacterium]